MHHVFFDEWLDKRVSKIKNIFGSDWFTNKKILEVGACHGDLGIEFLKLGADVLFTDARSENLEFIKDKLQNLSYNPRIKILDQNVDYNLNQKFDLVLHLGLLYHLSNWKENLKTVLNHTNCMILESLVYPFELDEEILQKSNTYKYDNVNGYNPVFSQEQVEQCLIDLGCKFIRFDNKDIDTGYSWLYNDRLLRNLYSWKYGDNICSNTHYRRMWLVLR